MLEKYFNQFLDYIFPIFCLGCEKEGELVCAKCLGGIQLQGVFCCPVCHRKSPGGQTCEPCSPQSAVSQTIALATYQENSILGKIIQTFKYDFSQGAVKAIDQLIHNSGGHLSAIMTPIDYIISIPLHRRRQSERGFNQAEIIARLLSKKAKIPLALMLTRSRATKQQAKLSRAERMKNVEGAFRLRQPINLSGKVCLVVDDVYTTGSTLQAAASVLRQAGAHEVIGFTLARG